MQSFWEIFPLFFQGLAIDFVRLVPTFQEILVEFQAVTFYLLRYGQRSCEIWSKDS